MKTFVLLAILFLLSGSAAFAEETTVHRQGKASVYSDKYIGKKTASGLPYNPDALTAASPDLPLGTVVHVTHAHSGKSVSVRITDRSSSSGGRVVDLSKSAANRLGIDGLAPVKLTIVHSSGDRHSTGDRAF